MEAHLVALAPQTFFRNHNLTSNLVLHTRNTAMAPPVKNPPRTSAQWFRYSVTLTTPTSTARQRRVRLIVGLVSREPLVLNTSVTYICERNGRKGYLILDLPSTHFVKSFISYHCVNCTVNTESGVL